MVDGAAAPSGHDSAARRTKIIATLGPSSNSPEMVRALIAAGVDVFRVNFSHAGHDDFARSLTMVREAAVRGGRSVAVLADLQGPKLRIGELENHQPVVLVDGADFEITTNSIVGSSRSVSTIYAPLPSDVKAGDRILLDDGALELRVQSTGATSVKTTVVHGGKLGEHKGMNLPGVAVSSPALTDKDRGDLAFAVGLGVDFVAISFVRKPEDVAVAKQAVRAAGADTPVIAKIEKPEAIERLEDILHESDAVMVARGDLGVEMPPEQVPTLQKHIIKRAGAHMIPVITATQMLESMIRAPRPTRAEASDVANAIIDGTDAIMLSGETAAGDYPVESVETMVRIAREAETSFPPRRERRMHKAESDSHAISRAACNIAESMDVRAIAAFTRTGFSARIVSKDKPPVPIYAFVPDETIARRLCLDSAVAPCIIDFGRSTEDLMETVETELLRRGVARQGEAVVVVGGTPLGMRGRTNLLKIIRAGEIASL
ncbi:MAG: pyruvate kinase [Candidatus Eremiobacteraeota bacterium]|nr:pyruvate kinase [Candidatus Eremiobacteraeota bacterium]MBC5828415.1 pyruvate kinase [Candidatus Eremiobacteraeota bacterium]